MKKDFYRDEFESYLQKQADELRMYPADRTWENISKKTRVPSRWPALPVISLFVISALVLGTVIIKPAPDMVLDVKTNLPAVLSVKSSADISANTKPGTASTFTPGSLVQNTQHTILQAQEKVNEKQKLLAAVILQESNSTNESASQLTERSVTVQKADNEYIAEAKAVKQPVSKARINEYSNSDAYNFSVAAFSKRINHLKYGLSKKEKSIFEKAGFSNEDYQFEEDFYINVSIPEEEVQNNKPLDRLQRNSSRFDFRFYVTPSVSYRRLVSEKGVEITGGQPSLVPYETSLIADASKAIRHSPATGYETGLGIGYKISKKLTLTTGAQFNISQYRVNAYLYSEQETASLEFGEGAFANTITTSTTVRSSNGSTPVTFRNRYYEVSVPIGLDWTVWTNNKLSWGVAGNVQPTYIFDKQPLVISNNFKNYADASSYIRNLNINASIETYFGFTAGKFRYQLGPQFRYQFLPTLTNQFQTREYLLNYGLKLGVVKYLR